MPPTNTAAYLTSNKAHPLTIAPAPYTPPGPNQLVIRTRALAINPVDHAIQSLGTDLFAFLPYPVIIGQDVSGTVHEVGPSTSTSDGENDRFKVGDRVTAQAMSVLKANAEGGCQIYVLVWANVCAHIPASMSFQDAAVFPWGVGTAVGGLFEKEYLGLELPAFPTREPPKGDKKKVLIWGGATSVGSNAIQLAVAAGYEVVSTASPHNFEYVKSLGASKVFDYHDPGAVDAIVEELKDEGGGKHVGAVAIGSLLGENNSAFVAVTCAEIVARCPGKKFVACAMIPPDNIPEGVEAKFIWGASLLDNHLGNAIYRDFLPKAWEGGGYKVAPKVEVVGKGLESIQMAFDILKEGVSAKKIVVLMD